MEFSSAHPRPKDAQKAEKLIHRAPEAGTPGELAGFPEDSTDQ
jgi:hypothetical protein